MINKMNFQNLKLYCKDESSKKETSIDIESE